MWCGWRRPDRVWYMCTHGSEIMKDALLTVSRSYFIVSEWHWDQAIWYIVRPFVRDSKTHYLGVVTMKPNF